MENKKKTFGVNMSGFFNAEIGFGEAIRNNLKALELMKIPAKPINFNMHLSNRLNDNSVNFEDNTNDYPVNIVHVNMDTIYSFFNEKSSAFFENKYNIGYWAWEMEEFPDEYVEYFKYYDEIWTCSRYCLDSISLKSDIPVTNIPHAIDINDDDINKNFDSGLSSEDYHFLFIFDYNSLIERKNTLALIDAYEKAFGVDNDKVKLVIKTSIPGNHLSKARKKVMTRIGSNKSIIYKEEMLRRNDLLALMNFADCYVSLHRSEGFGLTMAEAMALGKPVIATGYSGNLDFMTVNNSFLVKYKLIRHDYDLSVLPKNNYWSEPDTDHAAELMKFVFENQKHAVETGKRAKEDIHTYFSLDAIGRKMKKRLDIIENTILIERDDYEIKNTLLKLESDNKILQKRVKYLEKGLYNKARKKVNDILKKIKGRE
ncbi:glycosyltransferase family 4 protein [Chryseobacterium chendengshani]|uniref:glycosyltransferase family 4 protein n=1 Tax=Chryseobacterium sp. LJ668 TaxID=2864040 RepID=UPI001C688965|nr:glycosyltransferase family 4 protein [Chryseobacterium sp. LJ668]MBW8524713.1 glycosyltransferase family 4 protein [Chryseobacterium sp. LJ668]QYK15112.1 glycosyltransferase family 4 protein [Chryseobacterium sp. LJ668]